MFTRPAFVLKTKNPNPSLITDAEWWLWEQLHELESQSQLAGIYANKKGFHNTGDANEKYWPGNYSVRDAPNRRGLWWRTKASALDWMFPDAQNGDYSTISKYGKRLLASARDANDPRLDLVLYEFFGQADGDTFVEGFNEYRDEDSTSDSSHLWHIHFSFLRDKCGDFWAMWALLTVVMGWTVDQWRASLTEQQGEIDMKVQYGDGNQVVNGVRIPSEMVKNLQAKLRILDPAALPTYGVDGGFGDETAEWVSRELTGGDGHLVDGGWFAKLDDLIVIKRAKEFAGQPGGPGAPGKSPVEVEIVGPIVARVTKYAEAV